MDTNRLKRFATEARNILMQGVVHRLSALGFLPDGSVTEEPQQKGGGATFIGDTVTQDFYDKWQSLHHAVTERSVAEVAEEAAYTWFNRLVAIRILVKNGLASPVLEYESEEVLVPLLVSEARQGRMPEMDADSMRKLTELLDDDSKTNEQFALLIVAYCHENPIINKCFGRISDYTELLLPSNILTEGGFVYLLNHTEFIAEEDFRSPELIGWLYQFYISERKDEVFAKKGKFEADEIPAATQIFTPNWIVKYMVQNTVGRIYLDNNPYETELQEKWQYLVEPAPAAKPIINSKLYSINYSELEELKVGDLACGSGHILNECFDLLYDLYIAEGYGRGKAIENIFRHNLTGVDLDTRAKQLATFSLLLKACQKDNAFADAHCLANVLDMPEQEDSLNHFFGVFMHDMGEHSSTLLEAVKLCSQARDLGSIMKFDITEQDRKDLAFCIERWEQEHETHELNHNANDVAIAKLILALTEKYHALITNPPYMGRGHMTKELCSYLDKNYPTTKADLFSAFMEMMLERTLDNGKTAFITMESWMFLSCFEKFRKYILDNYFISSMGHFGWHIIGIAFGTAMTVIDKCKSNGRKGEYSYLTIDDVDRTKNVPFVFPKKDNGRYAIVSQQDFEKIPGFPIGYWATKRTYEIFKSHKLGQITSIKQGLTTSDNNRFIRLWHEVDNKIIGFSFNNSEEAKQSLKKWFPHNKGGGFRRWYGNLDCIVNYYNDGEEMKEFQSHLNQGWTARIKSRDYYFHECLSWSMIGTGVLGVRYYPVGTISNIAGPSIFDIEDKDYILGLLNTKLTGYFLNIMNPTMNNNVLDFNNIPIVLKYSDDIDNVVVQNIVISRSDWDSHETSWDYKRNELLTMDEQVLFDNLDYIIEKHYKKTGEHICIEPAAPRPESVEWCYDTYCTKWERLFMQLHENEEELNRQFINIYGLQNELPPDVPLDEVTILQQGEIKIEEGELKWNADVVMKQLVSYAVGCMMGRYSIDKPGLILANQGDGLEQYHEQVPDSRFEPDDDGIIPLMSAQSDFADNATIRFKQWLVAAFGEETLVENLNFIEKCLGKSIDDYFVKDFWKDHKKVYQNRPIYWLFSSKKGAFQCLAYMHRMDAYTAERIRTKYLLPHIEWLMQKQSEMEANAANLNARERKELDNIGKQIEECREYHDRLHVIADEQIAFNLDDGVVVNYAKFGDVLAKIK